MNKEAMEKIEQFKKARMGLLAEVQKFPEKHRVDKLFDRWDLKDVLAHIVAWDTFSVGFVEDFNAGEEPYDVKDNEVFNEQAVKESENRGWDAVHEDFMESGALLIETFKSVPDRLWAKRIWKNRERTLRKKLEIEIRHYIDHLKEIRKVVESLGD